MVCEVKSNSLLGYLTGRPYKNLLGIDSFQYTSLVFLFHNLRLQGLFYPVYVYDIIVRVSFFWSFLCNTILISVIIYSQQIFVEFWEYEILKIFLFISLKIF